VVGDIYVDIGPMDASKAPKEYADKAKTAMKSAVQDAVKSASGFTADKKSEGFTVRLKVVELKVDAKSASCKLSGELLRFPKPEMVSTSLTGSAKADGGKPDTLVSDCIEAVVESMMKKTIAEMKKAAR
jgi:hypothetical protein